MATQIRIDAEFSASLQPLSAEAFEQLSENIAADGCREPLVVWRQTGILLDGHHRLKIIKKLGCEYTVKLLDFADRTAAEIWILQNQAGRRNSSSSQLAMDAARLAELLAPSALARQKATQSKPGEVIGAQVTANWQSPMAPGTAAKKAGEQLGVSERSVARAQKVQKDGTPALQEAVRKGKISVTKAAKATAQPPEVQDKIAAGMDEAPPDEPPPVTDSVGEHIPDNLVPVFQRVGEITKLMYEISKIKSKVLKAAAAKDGIWGRLNVGEFTSRADSLRDALKAVKPHAVCPYCKGGEKGGAKNCDACDGQGWVDVFTYQMAAKELKK